MENLYKILEEKINFNTANFTALVLEKNVESNAVAIDIINDVANSKASVLYFSFKVYKENIVRKLICLNSGIELSKLNSADLSDDEWKKISIEMKKMQNYNVHICDSQNITISEIEKMSKKYKEKNNINLILIDYILLLKDNEKKDLSIEQQNVRISYRLKKIAQELKIPIVAIFQLSENIECNKSNSIDFNHCKYEELMQDADNILYL